MTGKRDGSDRFEEDGPSATASPQLSGAFALLADVTAEFAHSVDLDATLVRALESIVTQIGAEVGSLWLLDDGELVCRASVGPKRIAGLRIPVTQGIVGRSVRENRCQRVFDVREDPNFFGGVDQETGFVTRSILSAPMSFADETLGAVQLVNKRVGDGRFGEADAHLLQVLASSAALAIANARMATRLVEAERARRELELAAEIQRNLLPPPRPRPFPIFGVNVPARTVSGDFFDILPRSDGRIAFCLGDVSGKGVNAALLMAKTASLYRCLARSIDRPGRVLRVLNDELAETSTRGMFVTMVAGLFDPGEGHGVARQRGPSARALAGEQRRIPAGRGRRSAARDGVGGVGRRGVSRARGRPCRAARSTCSRTVSPRRGRRRASSSRSRDCRASSRGRPACR